MAHEQKCPTKVREVERPDGQCSSQPSWVKRPRARQDLAMLLRPTFKTRKKTQLNAKDSREREEQKEQGYLLPYKPLVRLGEFAEKN